MKKANAGRSRIEFSHLDKIFWPEAGYTKGDLIDYYQSVSEFIMPHIKDRPQSLLRQPNGYKEAAFFQKNVDHMPPKWIKTIKLPSESTGDDVNYLIADSLDSLLYMVQLGCIEINPWNSRVKYLNRPDWLVIDLDPEGVEFAQVVDVARAARKIFDELEIPAYPKTSGKTGIHIFVPLAAKYEYEDVRLYAETLAKLINQRIPQLTSLERHPEKRRRKVYIDYLQNSQGQTVAAPYCVRPTKIASVSTPLHWDEVKPGLDPKKFNLKNSPGRFKAVGDLWRPVLQKGVKLESKLSPLE